MSLIHANVEVSFRLFLSATRHRNGEVKKKNNASFFAKINYSATATFIMELDRA